MYDYFYGPEGEQFSFIRVPKIFFENDAYKSMSADAKILYGFLLDRVSVSLKNGWKDDQNRVFMHRFMSEQGYELDINDTRRHHEIYLSDARKVAPDKLKTVIRHPIRRKE